jgi:hypothetical protein
MVYIRMPGQASSQYDAGNTTSFVWAGAVDGQQYYFSVASYAGPTIGPRSSEISRYPNAMPLLTNPGPQNTTIGHSVNLQLTANDPDGTPLTYGASGLPPGLQINPATGWITGAPTATGVFTVIASVTDGQLSDAKVIAWTILAVGAPQPAPGPSPEPAPGPGPGPQANGPTPGNGAPTVIDPGSQTAVRGAAVALQLSGSDPENAALTFGAAGLPPGLQIVPGTGRISGSPTATGNYLVTITVTDGVHSSARAFMWTITQPAVDTFAPQFTITVPTAATTFTTNERFAMVGGSAADESGVREIAWVSDRGVSGVATGTDNWIAGIPLLPGDNRITIRARDAAGNVSVGTILIKARLADGVAVPGVGGAKSKRGSNAN